MPRRAIRGRMLWGSLKAFGARKSGHEKVTNKDEQVFLLEPNRLAKEGEIF